jgi:hypothetical protein
MEMGENRLNDMPSEELFSRSETAHNLAVTTLLAEARYHPGHTDDLQAIRLNQESSLWPFLYCRFLVQVSRDEAQAWGGDVSAIRRAAGSLDPFWPKP